MTTCGLVGLTRLRERREGKGSDAAFRRHGSTFVGGTRNGYERMAAKLDALESRNLPGKHTGVVSQGAEKLLSEQDKDGHSKGRRPIGRNPILSTAFSLYSGLPLSRDPYLVTPPGLDRQGVARLHRGAHRGARVLRARGAIGLDLGDLIGKLIILDVFTNPLRVIAATAVEIPRLLVHAIGKLQELVQVRGTKIEFLLGAAKVETPLRPEVPLGVLARVSLPLGPGGLRLDEDGVLFAAPPQHRLTGGDAIVRDARACGLRPYRTQKSWMVLPGDRR